jgi:HK97 gp10 family phage protein
MARVQNRERLLRKLAAIPQKVRQHLAPGIEQGAAEVVATAKRLAPKDSGALERSIRYVKGTLAAANEKSGPIQGDADLTVHIVAGDEEAWYARLVEFGTPPHPNKGMFPDTQNPGTAPRPYFYPAWRAYRKRVKSRITRTMKKGIKEAVKS